MKTYQNNIEDEIKIRSDKMITEKEGYEAMIDMLHFYWAFTGSEDLTDILSGGEYIDEDVPADSAFWYYWLDSIERVRNGKAKLLKEWIE